MVTPHTAVIAGGTEFVLRALSTAVVVALAMSIARPAAADEQAGATAGSNPSTPGFRLSAGYELHRDRVEYAFENPSTIDTPFLVPHRFAQTYVADNQWFVATARYRLWGDMMDTEFGLTPTRATTASDLDTFFDPDDTIVSGTDGDASMHAFRFAQWDEGRMWGLSMSVGYMVRRDVTDFRSSERIVTHSNPLSVSRTPIATHETTTSVVHELAVGVGHARTIAERWIVGSGIDVSPLVVARLTTILPEKYPGQHILFQAKAAALNAHAEFGWQRGRWPVTVTASYGHTFSYRAASQFARSSVQVGVRVSAVR